MTGHEKNARRIHSSGTSCSYAVYTAFSDINQGDGKVPAPKSIDGKCGAVLAAEKLLLEMSRDASENIMDFEKAFQDRFGSLKCAELPKGRMCNDYVGTAAAIVDSFLG